MQWIPGLFCDERKRNNVKIQRYDDIAWVHKKTPILHENCFLVLESPNKHMVIGDITNEKKMEDVKRLNIQPTKKIYRRTLVELNMLIQEEPDDISNTKNFVKKLELKALEEIKKSKPQNTVDQGLWAFYKMIAAVCNTQ